MEKDTNSNYVLKDDQEVEAKDPVFEQFDGILTSLTTFKSQITALQQQLRGLEKVVNRELTASRKALEKKRQRKANRKPSGFAKPSPISNELSAFMSKESGVEVARTEVTKFIIDYIKTNDLQNPQNRKEIVPNKTLKKLLNVKDGDEVTYFNLQKLMNRHFVSAKQN
tara:strand:+ start:254 stop:757 length:504 start_codon:yes stop_codon:yes gene_type:complete